MKPRFLYFAVIALAAVRALATTHYVNVNNSTPALPYTSWATAATNINDAIIPALDGDIILVTNGVYDTGGIYYNDGTSNRVVINKSITVQSVNGPTVTTIAGYQESTNNIPRAVRCVYLQNGAVLSGFTLTNGSAYSGFVVGFFYAGDGAGVYCQSTNATVTNCVIVNNVAGGSGGGARSGTLVNCSLIGNSAPGGSGGGGMKQSTLINCLVRNNFSGYTAGAASGGTLINCTVVSNSAAAYAGSLAGSVVENCIVYYNFSYFTNADSNNGAYVSNCCVSFATNSIFGENNFTNPPLFANPAAGDFHLNAASPCINSGNNSFIANSTDLDGNARKFGGGTVDLGAYELQAFVHYVNASNTAPSTPYFTWDTAATNIQDAIDVCIPGDFVVVSNGIYASGSRAVYGNQNFRLAINKPVTVQSLSGPTATTIICPPPTAVQLPGVYLTNGATLSGFTVTNGVAVFASGQPLSLNGGGVWCESSDAIVTNCWLIHNTALQAAGGGAFRGTLLNCLLTNNSAKFGGGACSNTLINCTLKKNVAIYAPAAGASGGGAIFSTLNNCVLSGNTSTSYGGGVSWSTLNNCVLSNNVAVFGGAAFGGVLDHCLVSSNLAGTYSASGGHGGAGYSNVMNNCLILHNQAGPDGDGVAEASALTNCTVCYNGTTAGDDAEVIRNCTMRNCVLYYNLHAFDFVSYTGNDIRNSCMTPPSSFGASYGINSITNEPLFVNINSDFHLQSNSPCINSGNNSFVANSTDLDSNARIAGGTVDIGAYEYQTPASVVSYAYLQQYGLPVDGSVDYSDLDGTGFDVYQDWIAGLNPTNSASILVMSSALSTNAPGITVTWQSVNTRTYYLQRSTNLTMQPAFSSIQSNIVGQAGATSYTDVSATNSAPYFYRVGVQ